MSRQQRIAAVPAATRAIDESDDDESVVAAIESARSRSSLCEDAASPAAPSLALPAGLSAGDVLPVTSEAHQGAEGAAACATALSPSSPPLTTSADDDGLAAGESLQVAILRVLPPGRAPMCRRSIRKALDDSFVRVVGVDKDARREALRDAIAALRSSGILHRTAEKTYVRRDGEAPPPAAPQPSAPAPTPPVIVCDGAPGCAPGMRPAHRGARKSCAGASELPGASPAPSSALCAAGADDAVPGQPMCVDGGAAEAAAAVEAVVAGRGGSAAADGARDDAALSHRLASTRVSALRRRAAAFEQRPGPLPAGCGTEAAVGAAGVAGAVPLPQAQARGPGHQLAVGERRISCSGGSTKRSGPASTRPPRRRRAAARRCRAPPRLSRARRTGWPMGAATRMPRLCRRRSRRTRRFPTRAIFGTERRTMPPPWWGRSPWTRSAGGWRPKAGRMLRTCCRHQCGSKEQRRATRSNCATSWRSDGE